MANLIKTMLEDGAAYGVCIDGTRIVQRAVNLHGLSPVAAPPWGAPSWAPLLWLPISRTIEGTFR